MARPPSLRGFSQLSGSAWVLAVRKASVLEMVEFPGVGFRGLGVQGLGFRVWGFGGLGVQGLGRSSNHPGDGSSIETSAGSSAGAGDLHIPCSSSAGGGVSPPPVLPSPCRLSLGRNKSPDQSS